MKTPKAVHIFALILTGIVVGDSRGGIALESNSFTAPGSDEAQIAFFVKTENKAVMLPLRTSYVGQLNSGDKNTWALNYHETSNYDGVDLILGVADRVLLVCDLWNQVRDVVVKKGILGPEPLDVVKLTVISVSNRELTCDLYVRSARSKAEYERKLIISIDASIDRVSLAVK